jgi:hypothetical protein
MNKLILTTLVAALSGVFAAPKTATAGGDEVAAAFGGFIGGVIVGSAINHDHDHGHHHGYHNNGVHVGATIEIGSPGYGHQHRHGYWGWTSVRVWVPGRWVVSYDRCGSRVRYFERGYYDSRRERVWMSTNDHRRCHDRDCG